jgi:CRP/FNR family transcriptional regulator, cyclic AMP receptor protein
MSEEIAVRILRRSEVFRDLTDAELDQVAELTHVREFANKQIIYKKDAESNAMFVLLSGRVRIMSELENDPSAIVATLGPGDLFGETSILQNAPRSAFAVSFDQKTELLVLMKEDLHKLLDPSKPMAAKILQGMCNVMAGRLRGSAKTANKTFAHMGDKFKAFHEGMDRINHYFAANMFYFR